MPDKSAFPTLALSAKWSAYPERFNWIVKHGFAAAYAPDPEALHTLPTHVDPLLQAGVPVRYHGFFPGYEIGDIDTEGARRATNVHLATLEAMRGRGEQVITIHIGLQWNDPIDDDRAVDNLSRLVDRARDLGITICVENLRQGPASDPKRVRSWADRSGAMMTLDVGHAVSCRRVQSGEMTVPD
ncbi:MAG: sugar phosphate isomerase/epimerase, partial [Anaerolineae bacterium]|nr:sugar phosphate isomerase/epimerase [Anaerolineae bacterium]